MEERISRLGVLILSVLEEEMAHNLYTGLTIKDIKEKLQEGVAEQEITFYRTIRKLLEEGYIERGIKDGKSHTYYIVNFGQELLLKVRKG